MGFNPVIEDSDFPAPVPALAAPAVPTAVPVGLSIQQLMQRAEADCWLCGPCDTEADGVLAHNALFAEAEEWEAGCGADQRIVFAAVHRTRPTEGVALIRTVLVTEDGHVYQSTGQSVPSAVAMIQATFRPGPWRPPIICRLSAPKADVGRVHVLTVIGRAKVGKEAADGQKPPPRK